jgi:hypothetical protein
MKVEPPNEAAPRYQSTRCSIVALTRSLCDTKHMTVASTQPANSCNVAYLDCHPYTADLFNSSYERIRQWTAVFHNTMAMELLRAIGLY